MTASEIARAAAELLVEFGDVESAERAAGARIQTACNASERAWWAAVRTSLEAAARDEPPVGERSSAQDEPARAPQLHRRGLSLE